jgi:RNA polymerase sigma-70 factor, ECF subfamily
MLHLCSRESDLLDAEQLRQRDAREWDALYDATCRRTYQVLYFATGAPDSVVEDLNQDVWLSAMESIERFDASRGTAQDWLLGIARFKALTYLRKQYRNHLAYVGTYDELPCNVSGHEQSLVNDERIALIRAAIASLPENWQYVLRQMYDQQMSVKQIAELTELSPKAIESTLARARQRLREMIKETIERSPE